MKFPYAYILSIPDSRIIDLLQTHGIRVSRLNENTVLKVEKFKIQELKGSGRLNQGHYTNSIKGKYMLEEKEFEAGTYIVTTNQKLGSLIASLLEPQSDDGLLKWNYFDRYLVPQWGNGYYPFPVYRLMDNVELDLNK